MIFSSVGRRFQTRGAATENALSPIFRLDRLTMKLLLLDDHDGSAAAGADQKALHAHLSIVILAFCLFSGCLAARI